MKRDGTWLLWRQDDIGSSSVIESGLTWEEAERRRGELEARGHRQHYWVAEECGVGAELNLVVVRAADLEAARRFYGRIALAFEKHKHGAGVEHLACEMGGCVFEIYPGDGPEIGKTRLGFRVADVGERVEALRGDGVKVMREAGASEWGMRAVVEDPDGRRVELTGNR